MRLAEVTRGRSLLLWAGLGMFVGIGGNALIQAQTPTCTPAPANMVGWWPGDGNPRDIKNGNNGTLVNGTTFDAGEVGQAFNFDGINDSVTVPHTASLDPSPSFTVEFWVYRRGILNASTFEGLVVQSQGDGNDSYSIFTYERGNDLFVV